MAVTVHGSCATCGCAVEECECPIGLYVRQMVNDVCASILIALGDNGPMSMGELRSFFNSSGEPHVPMAVMERAVRALRVTGKVTLESHSDARARQGGAPDLLQLA